jgi:hypothetical protein
MPSLDLTSAFDMVNIELLMNKFKIIGLPADEITLIRAWLTKRSYYVSLDGNKSVLFGLLIETVEGSILGQVLYAFFVSHLFGIEELFAFADDIFIPRTGSNPNKLVVDMEKYLQAFMKWMQNYPGQRLMKRSLKFACFTNMTLLLNSKDW